VEQKPYADLRDSELLSLCVWREAQNQPVDGMRGVAHVVRNRIFGVSHWWGSDWHSVILHPWQFSSFNKNDPNEKKWPTRPEDQASWELCCAAALGVFNGTDEDNTDGADYYYDTSIHFPSTWGSPANYVNTLSVGRLKFFRFQPTKSPQTFLDEME
jgi:N-acetylmuramoyl-L-alanine amidase